MSYWVKSKSGDTVRIKDPGVQDRKDLICPVCRCHMYATAINSTAVSAHFAGHHMADCDFGYVSDSYGSADDYNWSEQTIETIFEDISSKNSREATITSPIAGGNTENDDPKENGETVSILPITTLRQLFNVLAASDPDYNISEDRTVKDVYCGKTTEFLYTRYISGLHVVFAEYRYYNIDKKCLCFEFPTHNNKRIKIIATFLSDQEFRKMVKKIYKHTGGKAVIFADFVSKTYKKDNGESDYVAYCDIKSGSQIIAVNKR